MKVKIIEFQSKYAQQLKILYLGNIARTALPSSQAYQASLTKKYGIVKLGIINIFLVVLLQQALSPLLGMHLSMLGSLYIAMLFMRKWFSYVLLKPLISFYGRKVFQTDFQDIERYYGVGEKKCWIAINEENDELLGVVALDTDQGLLKKFNLGETVENSLKTCELKRMSIAQKAAGLKIGQLLTEEFLRYAAQKGFSFVYLTTYQYNLAALNLYERNGFKISLTFPFDKAHEILAFEVAFMVKKLNQPE